MSIVFYILIFFLGAVLGSFGGVIVERAEGGFAWSEWKKVFGGRSFCPGCGGKTLVRRQLIPLIGWLIQKGKCFRCKSSIPGWYCLIEIIMGAVFAVTTCLMVGPLTAESVGLLDFSWIAMLLINRLLVIIIIADLKFYELNVYAWMILMVVQLVHLGTMGYSYLMSGIIGSVVLGLIYYALYIGAKRYATKKMGEPAEGLGEGDVLMAFSIGLFTPFLFEVIGVTSGIIGIQAVFVYLILSSLIGMIYWVVRKGITGEDNPHMPFLPAMIVAVWVLLFWGESIVVLLGV